MKKIYPEQIRNITQKISIGFLLILGGFFQSDSILPDSQKISVFPQRPLHDVVSFFPFHFPMEVTFAPGYRPVVPSLGTQLLFPQPGLRFQVSSYENPLQLYFDPNPSSEVDPILRDRSGSSYWSGTTYRSPGVVFLVSHHPFTFHMDLNLRMTLDLSGQATANLLRSGFGVSYQVPSAFLASQQYSAKLDLSIQAIEFQPWEERRKDRQPIQRQVFLSPGITIGSQKGWMVEGLIRMPLPNNLQEVTDTTYRPEVQGRLGLKWYLPEGSER